MRPRNILILLAALVIVALVALSLADQLLVDFLWFGTLGYGGVFNTTVARKSRSSSSVWLVAFAAIFVSGLIAIGSSRDRERLRVVRRADEMVEVNLPELIRALGERVPWRVIVAGGAAILALFAAQGESSSWDTYLKGLYGVPFGITEPAFGNDIGFYVFTLPLLEEIRDLFLMLICSRPGWRSRSIGRAARSTSRNRRHAFGRRGRRICRCCWGCSLCSAR